MDYCLICKQRNVAFAFKSRNHRALRCFLDLSIISTQPGRRQRCHNVFK